MKNLLQALAALLVLSPVLLTVAQDDNLIVAGGWNTVVTDG